MQLKAVGEVVLWNWPRRLEGYKVQILAYKLLSQGTHLSIT